VSEKIRFAVVVSHPIQYYAPYYRALAAHTDMDVHAIFCSRIGLNRTLDPEMGVELSWKTDLLAGYGHEFLPEAERITRTGVRDMNNPSVGAALARRKPNIVLVHGYNQMTNWRTIAWCRRHGVPLLMISDSSLHNETPSWAKVAKRLVLPHIFAQFNAFLAIGDANQRYLETFGVPPERIFRVPNMVDEGFWAFRERRREERAACRARIRVTEDELAVLFVGKLIARKRPADLIEALGRLAAGAPTRRKVRLLLAGDGEERAALEAAAQAKNLPVTFLGFVNIDELPGIYCAADILAHPAEKETFGVIVLEAAILGLPLVLSDRVGAIGPTSIARPGENALIHACGDVDGLAEVLRRLVDEPGTAARLGRRSLEISEELGRMSVANTVAAVEYCLGRRIERGAGLTRAT
jgi:glycosyltransferase involved in cell wall biosynthesis